MNLKGHFYKSFLLLILAFVLLAPVAFAQSAPHLARTSFTLAAGGGDYRDFGYKMPLTFLNVNFKQRFKHVMVDASVEGSPTHKIQANTGYDIGFSGSIAARMKQVYAGVGFSQAATHNDLWNKTANRPFILLGIENGYLNTRADYIMSGGHDRNDLHGLALGTMFTPRGDGTGFGAGVGYDFDRFNQAPGRAPITVAGWKLLVSWTMRVGE